MSLSWSKRGKTALGFGVFIKISPLFSLSHVALNFTELSPTKTTVLFKSLSSLLLTSQLVPEIPESFITRKFLTAEKC